MKPQSVVILILGLGLVMLWLFLGYVIIHKALAPTGGIGSPSVTADPCTINGQIFCTLNADVTQATINDTICHPGWTTSIRPPTSYTNPLKAQDLSLFAYLHPNDPNWTMGNTEMDHRVPLELGGHPTDPSNLSPEDHPGSFTKDAAENKARTDVCNHRLTLIEAQTIFIRTYLDPWPGYIFPA